MISDYERQQLNKKQQLIIKIALFMLVYDTSIRDAAQEFNVPKTTIHRWIYKELRFIDDDLYIRIKNRLKSRRK